MQELRYLVASNRRLALFVLPITYVLSGLVVGTAA